MVNIKIQFLLLALIFSPLGGADDSEKPQITEDMLRGKVNQNAAKRQPALGTLAPVADLDKYSKKTPAADTPAPVVTTPEPVGSDGKETAAPQGGKPAPKKTRAPQYNVQPGEGEVVVEVVKKNRANFGIRLGQLLSCEIRRNIHTAEPGLAEIFLSKPFTGSRKTLPVNTQFFTELGVNSATKRMEMRVVKGITPEGDEFAIDAIAFDLNMVAGISGYVDFQKGDVAKKSVSQGVLAAGKTAAQTLGGKLGIAGAAVAEGANTALGETEGYMEQKSTNNRYVVHVSPQPIILRIERTF